MSQSLPLPASNRLSGPYVAAAGQTAFSVGFPFIADADLLVQVRADDSEAWATASLATDYSVTGAGAAGGGTVVFAVGRAEGSLVQVLGFAPVALTVDATPAGQISSSGLNRWFDRVVMWLQEMRRDTNSAVATAETANDRIDMIDGTAAEAASEIALQALADTITQKQLAEQAVVDAGTERAGAEAAEDAAALSASQAVAARDAAISAASIYPSTAAGVAATAVGDYFLTPGNADYEILFLYRVDAGPVATLIKQYITPGTVDNSYAQSGYTYVEFGADGDLFFGMSDGPVSNFVVEGLIELSPENAPKSAFNLGGTTVEYFGGSGYSQAGQSLTFGGSDHNELGGIDDSAVPQPTGAFSPFQAARPDYVAGGGCELFTRRDTNLRMQVYARDLATMAVRQLSSSAMNNICPRINALGTHAVWQCDGGDRWPTNGLRSRALNGAGLVNHAWPQRQLTVSGDSVDAGTGATSWATTYGGQLATTYSLPWTRRAIGGQQEWQQGMQLGAVQTVLTLASTTVATAGTSVTAIAAVQPRTGASYSCAVAGLSGQSLYPNTLLLSTAADATTRTLYGDIIDSGGVARRARLVRTASGTPSTSETYTLYSDVGVAITTASTSVGFAPDNADQLAAVAIVSAGLNDLGQGLFATNRTPPAASEICETIRDIQDAIVALLPGLGAYLVMGLYNQASGFAAAGTDVDAAIIASNAIQAAKYKIRFVDRRSILLATNDGSPGDLSDVANNYVPRSKRATGDAIHLNDVGHADIFNGNVGGAGASARLGAQLATFPLS